MIALCVALISGVPVYVSTTFKKCCQHARQLMYLTVKLQHARSIMLVCLEQGGADLIDWTIILW